MYNTENHNDLTAKCLSFMAEQGLPCNDQLIPDGKIRRYSSDAKQTKKDEWYVAYQGHTSQGNPYLYVMFGSWSTGITYEYKSYQKNTCYSTTELQEIKNLMLERKKQADEEIQKEHEQAASKAKELWEEYSTEAPSEDYLRYPRSKKMTPIGDVRFGLKDDQYPSLIIPIKNFSSEIKSLQYISMNETGKSYKHFLSGGEIRGNCFILGELQQADVCYVTEGYATGVSIYQAMNKSVVIVFGIHNMEAVISSLRQYYKNLDIIIAADADPVGTKKAQDAASKFFCKIAIPQILNATSKQNDFNDLAQLYGLDEVKKQLSNTTIPLDIPTKIKDPCSDFSVNYLPKPLAEYISLLCTTTKAHPIMITSSVLGMVSGFVGTKMYMPNNIYFQDLYPNLWMLSIAKSGQFKSTALNKGAKIALDKQNEVSKEVKYMERSAREKDSNITKDDILQKSRENIIIPTKLTAEGLLEYLDQGHKGVIYASEFGGWLQNLDKTHNNDFKALLTEFYDVPYQYRYKTKTQGDFFIDKPFISICGVSTMPWIRSNLKPSDLPSGFFARFLLFVPPHQEITTQAFPTKFSDEFYAIENQFKSKIYEILNDIGESRLMYPSQDAKNLIEQYHQYIVNYPKKYGPNAEEVFEPFVKRWSPYLIKLSMLLQLFIDSKTDQISDVAVMSAMKILMVAMDSTIMLFEGELGESEYQRKSRILMSFIDKKFKETKKPVLRQTIIRSKKFANGVKEYDPILNSLVEEGLLGYEERKPKSDSIYWPIEQVEKS